MAGALQPGQRAKDALGDECLIIAIRRDRAWVECNPDDPDIAFTCEVALQNLEPVPAEIRHAA
jgi:hypothetical protein